MGNESSQQSTVYGGKIDNDICITWNEVNNSVNGSFAGREGHCACAGYSAKSKPEIESPNLLYVFGGVIKNETGESDDIESNELLTYNTGKLAVYPSVETVMMMTVDGSRSEMPMPMAMLIDCVDSRNGDN